RAPRLGRRRLFGAVPGGGIGIAFAAADRGWQCGAVDSRCFARILLTLARAARAAARGARSGGRILGRLALGAAPFLRFGTGFAAILIALATAAGARLAIAAPILVVAAVAVAARFAVLLGFGPLAIAVEIALVMAVEILDPAYFAMAVGAALLTALRRPFLLASAEIAVDAEIMVGELQIIF